MLPILRLRMGADNKGGKLVELGEENGILGTY